jgi:hypothetical protein
MRIMAMGPAVAGSEGSAHTEKVIRKLICSGWSNEICLEILDAWNETCEPKWSKSVLYCTFSRMLLEGPCLCASCLPVGDACSLCTKKGGKQ